MRTTSLSLLVLAGAVIAIERAYGGAGLIDPIVLSAIGTTLFSGIALVWPSTPAVPRSNEAG